MKKKNNLIPKYRISLVCEGEVEYPVNQAALRSKDLADLLNNLLDNTDREQFYVFMMDRKNRIIGVNTVSVGSLNSSPVHPREVFKPAILCNADAVAFGHNHPSGDPTPSVDDLEITNRLVEAGRILGIRVLDHVIVGEKTSFVSFHECGLIEE
jgi:DNA repair protein RadC